MKRVIEHIRNKPEHKRHQIIWLITALVFLLLISSWVFVGKRAQRKVDSNFMQSFNQEYQAGKEIFKEPLSKQLK